MLSSTGPSAEYHGDCLGVFDYVQQYNNSPAYRQRHTIPRTHPKYLYKHDGGDWCVGEELGDAPRYLKNTTPSDSVPPNNWQYGEGYWQSDPELTVTTSLPSVCEVIRISLMEQQLQHSLRLGESTDPWEPGEQGGQSSVTCSNISV